MEKKCNKHSMADMNISNLHQMSILQPLCPLFVVLKLRPTALAVTTLMLYTERADLGAHKAPAQGLRTLSAKQLIEELEKETMQNCIVSFEGRGGGTLPMNWLAVEYAG
ncbi:hypothetical protein LQQ63_25425 (plasmid) [Escherichia coli]|nr:hypothetical protein LQQ63_25425 [Escherichia coli]